jgi:predicted nucleic acid-binding protein
MEAMKRIGLDTNVFMASFLDEANRDEPAIAVLRLIKNGMLEGVVGGITLVHAKG